MRLTLTTEITNLDGTPMLVRLQESGPPAPLTLRHVCSTALTTDIPGPQGGLDPRAPVVKNEHGALAFAMHGVEAIELTAEQVAMLKDRVGRLWGALVVHQAWRVLDPPAETAAA